ncbi:MAG TPA: thiol peroxidase, partial [Nitrospiria bacterium]|nr:thiol peroxidase [Nitrospiria bacterium]
MKHNRYLGTFLSAFILSGLSACGTLSDRMPGPDMTVSKETAVAGNGQTVQLKGEKLHLRGYGIKTGDRFPPARLTSTDMNAVDLSTDSGRVRVISIVPSLDTPVCEQQTHALSENYGGLDHEVDLITVSMDLPFAQKRFAREARIKNMTFLSDYRWADFGKNTGLLVEPLHLLARTVIVLDRENTIRHLQVVPELT